MTAQTVATQTASSADCANIRCQLFENNATLQLDTSFSSPVTDHAETSPVIFSGRHLLFYRTFIDEGSGMKCGIPQGIAMATSTDGINYVPHDGGKPLPAFRTVGGTKVCNEDVFSQTSTWVFAPDVIIDGDRLTMVFERRDKAASVNGASATNQVYYSQTTVPALGAPPNDGTAWGPQQPLLRAGAPGAWDHQVGTPDLEKDGSQYLLTFHGNNANGATLGTSFKRGIVKSTTLAALGTASRTQQVFNTPSWASYGPGLGDMKQEADGFWYMIFEAFASGPNGGAGGACGKESVDNSTAVGIARSLDAVTWDVNPQALLYGVKTSCGFDMPGWHTAGTVGFITPGEDITTASVAAVRWKVVPKAAAPTQVPATATALSPNQYMLPDTALQSPAGRSQLVFQSDGNLVHVDKVTGAVLWASDTHSTSSALKATRVTLQYDGNLVFTNAAGGVVAATGTYGHPDVRLRMVDTSTPPSLALRLVNELEVWTTPADGRGMS